VEKALIHEAGREASKMKRDVFGGATTEMEEPCKKGKQNKEGG